jgi:hypothetical protein
MQMEGAAKALKQKSSTFCSRMTHNFAQAVSLIKAQKKNVWLYD